MVSRGPLRTDPDFRCARCLGTAQPINGRTVLLKKSLRLSQEFCYLGDMLYACGGCKLAAVIRCKCGWGQLRHLLYLLSDHMLLLVNRGRLYLTCVRSVMLHVAETWAMTAATLNRLPRNDHAMIRWICNVKARDEVSLDSLLLKLGIQSLDAVRK